MDTAARYCALRDQGRRFVRAFASDQTGATAVEYSLLLSLIASACILSFQMLGGASSGSWGGTANKVGNAMATTK
jgi:pilus assembly protein Flp/PilA